nr:nucleic acid-binding, OB-fold protein [Tanacetum cinerariifolium]
PSIFVVVSCSQLDIQGLPRCNYGGGRLIRPRDGGMVAAGVGQRWGEGTGVVAGNKLEKMYSSTFKRVLFKCLDVIGHVIAYEDLDMYDKNGKSGKKKPLTLIDLEVFVREDVEKSKNTATRISTTAKKSTKETFVGKIPLRNIAELLDVAQGVTFVIVGTIIAIHEEEGWWYVGCRSCKKKVIREKDMIDLESDIPKKNAFVLTVLRLSDDPEILDSIRLAVTPSKMDTEATSSTLPNITPLDLESQTDENMTSTQEKNVVDHVKQQDASDGKNKRAAENNIGNESSNRKKRAIEVKTEKDV